MVLFQIRFKNGGILPGRSGRESGTNKAIRGKARQNAHAHVVRKTTLLSIRELAEGGSERVRDLLVRSEIGANFPDGVDLAFSLAQAETNKDERDQFDG